jgi:hypothetical protein
MLSVLLLKEGRNPLGANAPTNILSTCNFEWTMHVKQKQNKRNKKTKKLLHEIGEIRSQTNKSNARHGICPPIGTLSVGVWTIRFREKWNMVKIDDPQ